MAEVAESTPTVRPPDRRKLIAVVYADMGGYSRLISMDDAGTLDRLRTLRRTLIDPSIHDHGGRVPPDRWGLAARDLRQHRWSGALCD